MSDDQQLIIAGWNDYAAHDRDAMVELLVASAVASRAEPGCLEFLVAADPTNEQRMIVFERWESVALHAAHLRAEHVEQFRRLAAPYSAVDRSIRSYLVDSGKDL